jgi:hypothetical protein
LVICRRTEKEYEELEEKKIWKEVGEDIEGAELTKDVHCNNKGNDDLAEYLDREYEIREKYKNDK